MKQENSEVLVVEDDSMTSSVIVEFMIFDKIPVDIAHSFHDALQKFQQGSYRVVILDNKLGDGEGIALCELLKAHNPAVKMYLFAGDSESVKKKALALGIREVLQKPYDLAKLANLVKAALEEDSA
jgi:DNA-binding response OmpR family regulator